MFSYPLAFETSEAHIGHIKENQQFYRDVLDLKENNEELQKEKEKREKMEEMLGNTNKLLESTMTKMNEMAKNRELQEQELKKTKELLEDTTKLEDLLRKKNGVSVVQKGICDEKYIELVMKEAAGDLYEVDNGDGVRKMDVRLHRKDKKFSIGIECKDKDNVTKTDIDKFRRDKVLNKFFRSIFISTSPIKGYVEEQNQITTKDDELYIVSKDPVFIAGVMKIFLNNLETCDKKEIDTKIFDSVLDTYSTWQASKKHLIKLDKSIMRSLNLHPDFADEMMKGHVYFATRTSLKKGGIY